MRGLTSLNQKEIEECIDLIIKSTNGLNYLHEYFDINNVNCYVNLSFAYAYSFFCVLIFCFCPCAKLRFFCRALSAFFIFPKGFCGLFLIR